MPKKTVSTKRYVEVCVEFIDKIEKLEADNATKDERIRELETMVDVAETLYANADKRAKRFRDKVKALEAALTTARDALRPFAAHRGADNVVIHSTGFPKVNIQVTVGDIRFADDALGNGEEADDDAQKAD